MGIAVAPQFGPCKMLEHDLKKCAAVFPRKKREKAFAHVCFAPILTAFAPR